MIKQSKLPDNQILYSDERTNDPIAIAKVTDANRYAKHKKNYELSWHPTMQKLYPATKSLSRMNLGTSTSASDAVDEIKSSYRILTKTPDQGDPVKTTLVSGHTERMMPVRGYDGPVKFDYSHYHIHDPKTDKPIASLFIDNRHMKDVGTNHYVFDETYQRQQPRSVLEYHNEAPTEEQQKVLELKHPGVNPISQLHRVKTWLDTRHIEPTFVGSHKSEGMKTYKHKQTPEDAVNKYTEHLKGQYETKGIEFNHIAPGLAVGIKPAEGEYGVGKYHVVDAREPGKLVHIEHDTRNASHYKSNALNQVID